jgi:hypothetical protein
MKIRRYLQSAVEIGKLEDFEEKALDKSKMIA